MKLNTFDRHNVSDYINTIVKPNNMFITAIFLDYNKELYKINNNKLIKLLFDDLPTFWDNSSL